MTQLGPSQPPSPPPSSFPSSFIMPQTAALLVPPPRSQSLSVFSLALVDPAIDPVPAATSGGMQQTPYTSSQSVSSIEDSPSPRTPPISDSASSSSARATPSPNIQTLAFAASVSVSVNENESESGLCAAGHERFSPEPKLDNNAPVRHPEVVLTMQQPPMQHNLPPQPMANSGKGGCWTCRIRRKKCDEQRTDNACQTCIRLRIDCLGWGPKRPQWMRDKQAVEAYKAGIKEKLIKAGMVRGQPRLSQGSSSRSSTLPSGSATPSSSSTHLSYGHPHATSRSMSGPAAFGGLGAMGPIGPMGAFGVMGGSMPDGGMGYDFGQQHYAPQQPQPQPHSVRYGPYPSPRTLQGFSSPHFAPQHASHIPQAPSVMGAEFDYLGFADQSEHEQQQQQQQQHVDRRASFGVLPSHQRNTQQLENRRRSIAYTSSPSLGGGSSSHGNSPYIAGHSPLSGGPFGGSSSSQGTHASLLDFPSDVFGNMGSNMGSGMSNVSQGMSGLTVPGMNTITGVPGVSGSPSVMAGDESLLFSGGTYAPPPSRPSSTSASAPSRTDSAPGAGYSDALSDPSLVDPHIQYYFDSVMPMQYTFASERARGALQNLFAREPFGALVNASCALAAKHNKTIRVARLLDPPDADPQQSTAQQFFDRAYWQLANASARTSNMGAAAGYTTSDALASLHLVAYFSLQGGTGDWPVHLDMAREWLAQTGLCAPENEAPKETLALMGEAEQLAAKMTIWYDVFAAISQHQSPRFLATYRRLFGNTISREADDQSMQATNMDLFMGCPGDVLLILAETAALSQWKAQERQLGTLSNRELLRRGDAIEGRLLVSTIAEGAERIPSAFNIASASAATHSQMHPTRPSGEHGVPSPATSAVQLGQGSTVGTVVDATGAAHSSVASASTSSFGPLAAPVSSEPSAAGMGIATPAQPSTFNASNARNAPVRSYPASLYQRVAQVFLHTASLYLASVINEPSPSIPEINNAVNAIVGDLGNLSDVAVDRMLSLPLTLAGCLTDQPEQRHFIRSRLCALDEAIGNVRSVRLLMERVWTIHDAHGGVVDWRDVMRSELGVEILLV